MAVLIYELKDFYHFWPNFCTPSTFFMFSAAWLETSVFTEWHLYETGVKLIVNMLVVRLTYRVTPNLIISGMAGKKKLIRLIWMQKSTDQKITNSNKQTMSILLVLLCSVYMDSVILLPGLPFSGGRLPFSGLYF